MNDNSLRTPAKLGVLLALVIAAGAQAQSGAQTAAQSQTLTIAGRTDQATVVQVSGKSYIDIESLARITHGSLKFQGSQIVLTLPSSTTPTLPPAQAQKTPQLSEAFLRAEIEALTDIREWRVSIVNAVQNNYPVTPNWVGLLQRSAQSKVELAIASATTEPDHSAVELLKNELAGMRTMSDGFLATHASANYIPPTSFDNNPQDQKILDCSRALASMAATKQFQDEPSCH